MNPSHKSLTLSIVIPAFNEEARLDACLQAIAQQTAMPHEVIVVDNNSTDRTAEIAKRYPFVRLLHEPKQGRAYARNCGFDAARGDIIGRIDADTILPQTWAEQVLVFFTDSAHAKHTFTGGTYFYNLYSGKFTGYVYGLIVHGVNRLMLGYYFPWGSNCALWRQAWRAARENMQNRTDIHEDLDLGIQLHRVGYDTAYHPSLKVGAMARRILSERSDLWEYLAMWPKTFRVNGIKTWWLIWPFVLFVWLGSYGILLNEKMFGIFARTSK